VVVSVVAVSAHYSMGHFSNYHGIALLQEQLVDVSSSSRGMRLQGLAAETEEKEEEEEAIRFENDRKVGGGDLMVPVSMVDYENLGEGSIVDQRYPRKLPGSDELEAEWNALWNWDWENFASEPISENATASPSEPKKQSTKPKPDAGVSSRLEDMGVNVNGYHKDGKK